MVRFDFPRIKNFRHLSSLGTFFLAAMFSQTARQVLLPEKSLSYHRSYVATWRAINVDRDRRARAKTYFALAVLLYYASSNLGYAFLPPDLESSPARLLLFDSWFILICKRSTNLMAFFVCLQLVYFTHFMYLNDNQQMFAIVNDVLLHGKVGRHFGGCRFYNRFQRKVPVVWLMRTWYLVWINALQLFILVTCK